MGIGFVAVYTPIWGKTRMKAHWISGIGLGIVSGLAGIAMWEATLRLHHNPPKLDKKNYYRQLMIAHIIFGITSGTQWQLIEGEY